MLEVSKTQKYQERDKKEKNQVIEYCFIFCATWSMCISVYDITARKFFDTKFKQICNGDLENQQHKLKNKILPPTFDRGTIYDYRYLPDTNEWKNWMDFVDKESIDKFPKGSIVQELIVTT